MGSDSFSEFVTARSPALVRFAWLLTGDWGAAEDLLQIALTQTWRHWPRVEGAGAESYVRTAIARAHVSRWRRRSSREVPLADTSRDDPADDTRLVDMRRDVVAALKRLPPRQRAVVVMRYYLDLSEADIARELGVSAGTVKSQAAKAVARLKSDPDLLGLWTGEPTGGRPA